MFKRTTVQRILTGEKTVAELSRDHDIAPSVIWNWARPSEAGATTTVAANEDMVPVSYLREAYGRIRACSTSAEMGLRGAVTSDRRG